jgi:hypothetical protein
MDKSCRSCHNYKKSYCKLNPIDVKKDPNDICSHWTPRMVNENINFPEYDVVSEM